MVCSGNARAPGREFDFDVDQAFVSDQVAAVRAQGVEVKVHLIRRSGLKGYFGARSEVRRRLEEGGHDLVHAHVGTSGIAAVRQGRWPSVVTFHGSDVNMPRIRPISTAVSMLADWRVFVSEELRRRLPVRVGDRFSVLPCGVDTSAFRPMDRRECRRRLGLDPDRRYVLFSSGFDNPVKNAPLARQAMARLEGEIELLEFKGVARGDAPLLVNAADVLLMTSRTEGSPQVVKEALACDRPVVSVDVGDVRDLVSSIQGCEIVAPDPGALAAALRSALAGSDTFRGAHAVRHLDNAVIAKRLIGVYRRVSDINA